MALTLEEYETFIYALPARYPAIQHAVLNFIRLGPLTATVRAEIFFLRAINDECWTVNEKRILRNRRGNWCTGFIGAQSAPYSSL
jgi:hypothetical protein